eukprot:2315681-Amphidinium_carterae.1
MAFLAEAREQTEQFVWAKCEAHSADHTLFVCISPKLFATPWDVLSPEKGSLVPVIEVLRRMAAVNVMHADIRVPNIVQEADKTTRLVDYDSVVGKLLLPRRCQTGSLRYLRRYPRDNPDLALVVWQLALLGIKDDELGKPNKDAKNDRPKLQGCLLGGCRSDLQLFNAAWTLEDSGTLSIHNWEELLMAVKAVEGRQHWGAGNQLIVL